jgi:hypothetical protein
MAGRTSASSVEPLRINAKKISRKDAKGRRRKVIGERSFGQSVVIFCQSACSPFCILAFSVFFRGYTDLVGGGEVCRCYSDLSEVPGKAAARRGKGRFSEVRGDDAPISISPLVADIFCCLRTISVFKGIHRYIAG